jgi:vacuolar-type H+-ATPase subunit I/STV1
MDVLNQKLQETEQQIRTMTKYSEVPLEVVGFSARTFNGLKRIGINTISDLAVFSLSDLKKVRNLGTASCNEIIKKMDEYGYILREHSFFPKKSIDMIDNQEILEEIQLNAQVVSKMEKEVESIKEKIAEKEKLLATYMNLIDRKRNLILREKELDDDIEAALKTLKELGVGKYVRRREK